MGAGSFFARISGLGGPVPVDVVPGEERVLEPRGCRVGSTSEGYLIRMGEQHLYVCPDPSNIGPGAQPGDGAYLLYDPERYGTDMSPFLRLEPGEKLALHECEHLLQALLSHPDAAATRRLEIQHAGDGLVFRERALDRPTHLSALPPETGTARLLAGRRAALERIARIYGGPIQPLEADEALDTLRQVNALLEDEPWRERDSRGAPGGVVRLPLECTPIIVGDLHGRVDNLLRVLIDGANLECLERGTAVLVLLGDLVHPDDGPDLGDMAASTLLMDVVFRLKHHFPRGVQVLLGNHDSFSPDIRKGGIPQGVLWRQWLSRVRGEQYCLDLQCFYERSPLVALSDDFAACHAGPPRVGTSLEALVDVRQHPKLAHEVTWNRQQTPGFPAGYTPGDVRRLRKALGLVDKAHILVGHYPRDRDGSIWLNTGRIPAHHVVYSARPGQVGVASIFQGEIQAHVLPVDDLVGWVNGSGSAGANTGN